MLLNIYQQKSDHAKLKLPRGPLVVYCNNNYSFTYCIGGIRFVSTCFPAVILYLLPNHR